MPIQHCHLLCCEMQSFKAALKLTTSDPPRQRYLALLNIPGDLAEQVVVASENLKGTFGIISSVYEGNIRGFEHASSIATVRDTSLDKHDLQTGMAYILYLQAYELRKAVFVLADIVTNTPHPAPVNLLAAVPDVMPATFTALYSAVGNLSPTSWNQLLASQGKINIIKKTYAN